MSYLLTQQLPSCFIERKLLLELEDYFKRKAKEFVSSKEDTGRLSYEFTIIDRKGIETLNSVEDFKRSYFPDDTLRIGMECRTRGDNTLTIEAKFSTNESSTTLTVRFDGNSAREVTAGIAAEIESILGSYKTSNLWFYPPKGGLLFAVYNAICIAPFMKFTNQMPFITQMAFLIAIMIVAMTIYAFFRNNFKPYSTFETKQNERRKKQVNWVILGILGFILFTVIGVYFRQKIFGF